MIETKPRINRGNRGQLVNLQHFRSRSLAVISFQNIYLISDQNGSKPIHAYT